jgi:hypothetical protein
VFRLIEGAMRQVIKKTWPPEEKFRITVTIARHADEINNGNARIHGAGAPWI